MLVNSLLRSRSRLNSGRREVRKRAETGWGRNAMRLLRRAAAAAARADDKNSANNDGAIMKQPRRRVNWLDSTVGPFYRVLCRWLTSPFNSVHSDETAHCGPVMGQSRSKSIMQNIKSLTKIPISSTKSEIPTQNFWDLLYMRAHSMRNSDQILHGDQTRCQETFYTVDHEWTLTSNLKSFVQSLKAHRESRTRACITFILYYPLTNWVIEWCNNLSVQELNFHNVTSVTKFFKSAKV